ncbi:hypothetical protein [Microbulbifer aggregans]|uniref:hypothetical protein n=1 Tax=Microbulbifer aggregans TaxID=1769779 RepID=UPI001CFF4C1A|nr:hypothetical protein [Microbulbifer aggregans]
MAFGSVKRLCLILVALLVFQTAAAFSDSHEDLSASTSHLPASHQDAADGSPHLDHRAHSGHSAAERSSEYPQLPQLLITDHNSPDLTQDCNHCCHCHSAGCLALLSSTRVSILSVSEWFQPINAGFPRRYISALLRPPIA